jgi:hypothetical protein
MTTPNIVDRALWITWYDLPEDGRDAHLRWVHDRYIPAVMERPGVLWAAHYASLKKESSTSARVIERKKTISISGVPTGRQYILLFGAADAHVFADPVPGAFNAGLPEADRKMLALRVGARMNVMAEAGRVEGPEAKSYTGDMTGAPCIQMGNFDHAWQEDEDIMAWYVQSRMAALAQQPGCIRVRKLVTVSGWGRHGILYEYPSLEAQKNYLQHENKDPGRKAWADRTLPKLEHAPGSSYLACRIWPEPG